MPEQETLERAREDAAEGKSPSTQAGEFVREEIHHVREGKHGARSTKQAIAIGLSKARRAGVKIPAKGKSARKKASSTRRRSSRPSAKRARAVRRALKREPHRAVALRTLRGPQTLGLEPEGIGAQSGTHAEAHGPITITTTETRQWHGTARQRASASKARCVVGNAEL